jgi:DNA-binding transcriptional LysR family regulator
METLANLESFVRSAETGSFSTTARRLSLTPAAVSRNVAMLERNLGVRLFHRSTRKLTLTEAGERLLHAIRDNLEELQASIASVATDRGEPTGVLKVSMGLTFGVDYIVPLLPEFMKRYPNVRPDWQFESRQVDLIAEGFDAAIGGGIELATGLVTRTLAPLHIIAVASPAYVKGSKRPVDPSGLARRDNLDHDRDCIDATLVTNQVYVPAAYVGEALACRVDYGRTGAVRGLVDCERSRCDGDQAGTRMRVPPTVSPGRKRVLDDIDVRISMHRRVEQPRREIPAHQVEQAIRKVSGVRSVYRLSRI